MFKIEKNVAIPAKSHPIYPFADLRPGDSFLVPCGEGEIRDMQQAVHAAASYYSRKTKTDYKIATRTADKGLRVWRVQ
jgi:hypothetical protein